MGEEVRFDTGEVCSPRYELKPNTAPNMFIIVLVIPYEKALEAKRNDRDYRMNEVRLKGTVRWHDPASLSEVHYKVEVMDKFGDWVKVDDFWLECGVSCDDPLVHEIDEDVTRLIGKSVGVQLVRISRIDPNPPPSTAGTTACFRMVGSYEVV